eukprot:2095732-Rhodomonas_salina.2
MTQPLARTDAERGKGADLSDEHGKRLEELRKRSRGSAASDPDEGDLGSRTRQQDRNVLAGKSESLRQVGRDTRRLGPRQGMMMITVDAMDDGWVFDRA